MTEHFQLIYEAFDKIFDRARQLYADSEKLKRLSIEQGDAIGGSSAAMTEISSMLEKTVATTQDLLQASTNMMEAVDTGQGNMTEVQDSIGKIKRASLDLQDVVKVSLRDLSEITKAMEEIRAKATVINEIVFQTKLLSFNASVEASRAGEAGKGFAVVADEMGRLAQTSGAAAKEIEQILQESTEKTVQAISSIQKTLERSTTQSIQLTERAFKEGVETAKSFDSISSAAQRTRLFVDSIVDASREQSLGVDEVTRAMTQLKASSHELMRIAGATFDGALYVSQQSEKLVDELFGITKKMGVGLSRISKPFDFKSAKAAHIDWKMKLSNYLISPDRSLDPEKVCKDNACVLGKWIYGDGAHYEDEYPDTFKSLRSSHSEFHATAAKVITMIHQQNEDGAKALLSPKGEYSTISDKTVGLIEELQMLVESGSKASH